jgi:hypothetical protein
MVAGGELSLRLPLPAQTGSLAKCERTLGEGKAGPRQEMPESPARRQLRDRGGRRAAGAGVNGRPALLTAQLRGADAAREICVTEVERGSRDRSRILQHDRPRTAGLRRGCRTKRFRRVGRRWWWGRNRRWLRRMPCLGGLSGSVGRDLVVVELQEVVGRGG